MPGTPRSTGMPGLDAQTDFLRARRRAALGAMVARLRGEPDDVRHILPYEEVVAALGLRQRALRRQRGGPARCHRRHRRPRARLRSQLPPHHGPRALTLGAHRHRDAARRGDAAGRPRAHRARSTSSATGTTGSRWPARSGTPTSTRWSPRSSRASAPSARSRSTTCRSRATSGSSSSASRCPTTRAGEIKLTDPWDYGRLAEAVEAWGFRAQPGSRRADQPARDRLPVAGERVPPGDRDAARGGSDRHDHRDRGLHARQRRALPAAAHPLLGRGCARRRASTSCRRRNRRRRKTDVGEP